MRKTLFFSHCLILVLFILITTTLAAPVITLLPPQIEDPDVEQTIRWSGIESPQLGDALIIYLVPRSAAVPVTDPKLKKAMGFYWTKEYDPGKIGSGTIKMPIYLPRDMAFYFEYTRITDTSSTVITTSPLLVSVEKYRCQHFHLATTHINNEMLVQYVTTDTEQIFHYIETSLSPFGTEGAVTKVFQANDTMLHYSRNDMFEEPATSEAFWVDPGRFRQALIVGLLPNTPFYYRVVDENKKPISKSYSFISPYEIGSEKAKTDLFIFGDLGIALPFYSTVQQQAPSGLTTNSIFKQLTDAKAGGDRNHRSLLLIGDISYARGYHWMWDWFFKQIEPISSQIPFHVSIGNHEYDYLKQKWKPDWSNYGQDSGGEGGIPTFRRFQNPADWHVTPYTSSSWYKDENTADYIARKERGISYSYDTGVVHIIVFSAEHDFTKGSSQYKFMEQDLINVDRKRTPWVIVTSHRPMYCSASGCSVAPSQESKGMDWRLRQELESLLVQYKVNLYIAGHNHHYARSCMISGDYRCANNDENTTIKDGVMQMKSVAPLHVLTGASGNSYESLYQSYEPSVYTSDYKPFKPILHHDTPKWLMFRTMSFGYSQISANYTHLTQTFYGNQYTGIIHDRFILTDPI